jgi:hypothetical protein
VPDWIPYKGRGSSAPLLASIGVAVTALTLFALDGAQAASGAARTPLAVPSSVSVSGVGDLSRIACPTASECVAVGTSAGGLGGAAVVVKVPTGAVARGAGSLLDDALNAVTCPTSASCLAVADEAVVAVSPATGAAKVVAAPQKPAQGIDALGDIACAGTSACYAVGFQGTEADSHALVVELSATGRIEKTTLDTGTGSAAIACPTPTQCLVADDISRQLVVQVFKDGVSVASHALPAHTYVESMSCFGASVCSILGGNSQSSPSLTDELLSVDPVTGAVGAPVSIGGHFSGASLTCISASSCLVAGYVGTGDNASAALVVVNHGKPDGPAHYPGRNLDGVACASPTACFAVGLGSTDAIVDRVAT